MDYRNSYVGVGCTEWGLSSISQFLSLFWVSQIWKPACKSGATDLCKGQYSSHSVQCHTSTGELQNKGWNYQIKYYFNFKKCIEEMFLIFLTIFKFILLQFNI